ncbi:MAG: hypothetical protein LBU82_04275, partial [Treponema sp.]|nr:hypothetical protein [Treponema sp.]
MDDPSSPQSQAIAESQQRRIQRIQDVNALVREAQAQRSQYSRAQNDYYQSLREQYSEYANMGWNFSNADYLFIDAVQPIVNSSEDPQFMKERIAAASMYANLFQISIGTAFLDMERLHQEWTGQNFVKKTGVQAVWDSLQLSFVSREYNRIAQQLARQGGTDPILLQAAEEYERRMERLRDHAPKVWQDEYVRQGGWADVGQFFRSAFTSLAENAVPVLEGMGLAALAATGAGAFATAAGLSSTLSGILVAGASRAAIAGSTYNSTWGIKYREMTNQGIPHDIAVNYARIDAFVEGLIEAGLGGVESAGARAVLRAAVPQAASRAAGRFFISGRMGAAARAILSVLKEGVEEGTEELFQGFSSGGIFNAAADEANRRRDELLQRIAAEPFDEIRREIERELENHPEVARKEWEGILDEAIEGGIAGLVTGIILGIPVEIGNARTNVRAARALAGMAQAAPNLAAFTDAVKLAEEQGLMPILEGMKSDEKTAYLTQVYNGQQERLTPEQRETKRKEAEEAAALAEVTGFNRTDVDEETGEFIPPDDTGVYRENGRLFILEDESINEDGTVRGLFAVEDPRIKDEGHKERWYAHINYTESGNEIAINDFVVQNGYESIRQEFYDRFAQKHAGKNIAWETENEANIAFRGELINSNRRGPKEGLNYYEDSNQARAGSEARQVAARIAPRLEKQKSTPLEIALAVELVKNISRRPGESLSATMNRLVGRVTNDASERADIEAAQRQGKTIKGATWLEQTAEGMRRVVYFNKNASDVSTVIHELAHAVESEFSEAERKTAIDALNGYKLKDGKAASFDLNTPFEQWDRKQRDLFSEAFAEGFENYLINGTAPNEQIKGLFEKIKEFMKRVYKTLKGWTELSPNVEEFYKSLFSGESEARAETAPQTGEQGYSEAQTEKKINDTERDGNAAEAPQEGSKTISPTATTNHTAERDRIISDPDIPLEEKTEAVFDAAGEALFQAGEYDPNENPIECLKANAKRLADIVERDQVLKEIDELARMYPPESNRYLAPNGKASNLNHAQWYAVRTPSFKEWFGDWELEANAEWVFNAKPVKELKGTEFAKSDTNLVSQVAEFFNNIGGMVEREGFGTVDLTRQGIRSSIAHGVGRDKAIAFMAVPDVIKNGKIIDHQTNWKGRGYDTYVIDAPITIRNVDYIAEAIINQDKDGQRFYLHEVEIKEKAQGAFKTATERSAPQAIQAQSAFKTGMDTSAPQASRLIISKKLEEVKGNVSKIVDENGEPLAVYHGTKAEITEFDVNERIGHAGRTQAGSYFTRSEEYASTYGTKVYSNFLNIRNPYITDTYAEISALDSQKINTLIGKGYDGVVYNELAETGNPYAPEHDQPFEEICAFNPSQIKSATDNAGTFDPNNPSILFQTAYHLSDEQIETIEAVKAKFGITTDIDEAGYLLIDGTMLDLSGGRKGSRSRHHAELDFPFKHEGKTYKPGMGEFMAMGNIRLKPEIGGIDLTQMPNNEQVATLREYICNFGGNVVIDFSKLDITQIDSLSVENCVVYRGAYADRVLNDIKNYYEKGIVPEQNNTLFQIGDRDMVEEAADFENGKTYREYCESEFPDRPAGEYEEDLQWLRDDQIDAWYEEFVRKAKQAVRSASPEAAREGKATPAELDLEFNQMIEEKGRLEEFVKMARIMHNEDYSHWQPVDEDDAADRDRQAEITDSLRKKLRHVNWQTAFEADAAGREMKESHRKRLLKMVKNSPRDYRAIYAQVMDREDLAVSAEDFAAEALKYPSTYSMREEIDSMTPEQLRQLEMDIGVEEFGEKYRLGRVQISDPAEKEYFKRVHDQVKKGEETLKEINEDRQDDNNHIENMVGKEFLEKFDRASKLREEIRRKDGKLDRAIKEGQKDASRIARRLYQDRASYESIVRGLEALAEADRLELNVREILEEQHIKDAAKAARTETKEKWEAKYDGLKKEYSDYRKSAKAQSLLRARLVREQLKAHIEELQEKQESAKIVTKAKKNVINRIKRKASPREVDADYGMRIIAIQRFAWPSLKKGINEFMGEIVEKELGPIFGTWKVDERLRADLLNGRNKATQSKMSRLFGKEKFEDLTDSEKRYLARKIAPMDWIDEFDLEEIDERRERDYPVSENERQIAQQYLPADVYFRIMDKPFSAWTLAEAEELAKIIDDLTVQGKEIYKAHIEAERRRIMAYQEGVVKTVRDIPLKLQDSPGDTPEERARKKKARDRLLAKYDEGMGGTEESAALREKTKGLVPKYANMNVYRFARMLDNGDTKGKNSAALYRMARDAQNSELKAKEIRREKVLGRMKELGVRPEDLWQKTVEVELGGQMGTRKLTAWEMIGFLMATRDAYSRAAVVGGNLLVEPERTPFQKQGITGEEVTPLKLMAEERFTKMKEAALKLVNENPGYQQIIGILDEDFASSGKRTGDALLRYNNTIMETVEYYFPMRRTEAVSSETADAELAKKLMGSSAGAFNMFVEKGFVNGRVDIPIQYQTAIKLDAFAVWAEAVEREEHFIAYGQAVKDLNKIYKQSRPVRYAIHLRYGRDAVKYIDKYINELANPDAEKSNEALDGFIRAMRGNAAAAYLGFNVTSIIKQAITSPAPFIGYMNPLQYAGALIEYTARRQTLWREISELSPYMKNRSANMMVDMIKERSGQKFKNKADAAISRISGIGMKGLEWIDEMCVAPGWLVLYRKEFNRLTKDQANASMDEKDIKVKAAGYADEITRAIQPSGRAADIAPLFKGNNELAKAFLQFTQSL